MFKKILIANRGEIACRIIKTARRMGITTVALYSTVDSNSLHVSLADEAFCVGPAAASESYLNIPAIIAIAVAQNVEAIHPGYGFLSENPHFAEACHQAGIIFIGPSIKALEIMGSKQAAKQLLENSSVPLTPGYHGQEQSEQALLKEAKRIGFPVLLKAANGGGGKGMRAVRNEADFSNELAGARREAKAYFADEVIIIEKLLENPRHIEMQIMADAHGNLVHIYERDCSIQRRHQKIIEEAAASSLSPHLRQQLAEAALTVARKIQYQGAGTIEFLVDSNEQFYFMEMNTRLQVEHPVTEMITQLDLVEWQLRIAANEPLPLQQNDIHAQGHAIECRICAEDPENNFLPSIGKIHFLKEPSGEHIRIDSGIRCNDEITMHYDPMIAKLIVWGETRDTAVQRMQHALAHYHIGGVKTNIAFLQALIHTPHFIQGQITTHFLTQESIKIPEAPIKRGLLMAASIQYLTYYAQQNRLGKDTLGWQMHLQSIWYTYFLVQNEKYTVCITPKSSNEVGLRCLPHETEQLYKIKLVNNQLYFNDGKELLKVDTEINDNQIIIYFATGPLCIEPFDGQNIALQGQTDNQLTAPMPATVVAILKQKGEIIKLGDSLMILEAMKMEHTIRAPGDGILADIYYTIGEQVSEGAQLIALEPLDRESP